MKIAYLCVEADMEEHLLFDAEEMFRCLIFQKVFLSLHNVTIELLMADGVFW